MKIICITLLLIIGFVAALGQVNNFPFQRKIWMYWTSKNNQKPIFVKACMEKIQILAKRHNFQFVVLNQSNVRNYVANYDQEFLAVRKKSIQKKLAHDADLLRIIVLAQQGGIWLDSTVIFPDGLTELENIMMSKYEHLITNRFTEEPDVLLFYFCSCQNRIQTRIIHPQNNSKSILYNQIPNFEIWALIAKKNTTLMRQIQRTYSQFTVQQFQQVNSQFIQNDTYINRIDNAGNYFYANMAITHLLQQKQKQLDKNLTLFSKNRPNVFQYYKLWGLHAELGPLMTIRDDFFLFDDIFVYSKQELEQMNDIEIRFFMKFTGYSRYVMDLMFNYTFQIFKDQEYTFENFMADKPSLDVCRKLTLIKEGSIIHSLFNQTSILNDKRIKILTNDQYYQWKTYCASLFKFKDHYLNFLKHSFWERLKLTINWPDRIHWAKIQEILAYDQLQTMKLGQRLKLAWKANFFLVVDFGIILCLSTIIFSLFYLFKSLFVSKISSYQTTGESNFSIASLVSNESQTHKKSLIRCLIFILFVFNLTLYHAVDILGGRQQPFFIFLCICLTFYLQSFIQKKIQYLNQKGIRLEIEMEFAFFSPFVIYITAYMCLVNMRKHRFMLNYFAFVIGLIGSCIFRLKRILEKRFQDFNPILNLSQNTSKTIILTVLLLLNIFPNLSHMAGQHGYYIKYLPFLPTIYILIIYIQIFRKCLQESLLIEQIRLVILALMAFLLYQGIDQGEYLATSYSRMAYVFRTVMLMSYLYVQMGNDVWRKSLYKNLSLMKVLSLCFGVVVWEIIFGRVCRKLDQYSEKWYDFTEHFSLIGINAFLISFFLVTEHQNSKKNNVKIYPQQMIEETDA